jgi:CDP-diglyceride synthetase
VYPIANDTIHAIRAQLIQNQLQGGPIGSLGYVIVVSVLFATLLALLIWIYRSITNVKRSALRFQAVLFLILTLLNIHTTWPELKFAFENLNSLFAVLATLSVGITLLVVPVSEFDSFVLARQQSKPLVPVRLQLTCVTCVRSRSNDPNPL